MKKYGIYLGVMLVVCSLFSVTVHTKSNGSLLPGIQRKKGCALCGEQKDSLKSIYGSSKGVGLICLNEWRVVRILAPEDENMKFCGMTFLKGKENDYSIMIEHVVESKISLVDYTGGKANIPDIRGLSEILCAECLLKVKETVTIQGRHGKRNAKAVCLVEFPSMEIHGIQQDFQYYVLDGYYVQSYCEKKKINLTVFSISPEEDAGNFRPAM